MVKKKGWVLVGFLALITSVFLVSAVQFTEVGSVTNPDNFYSPYETWINVSTNATITGAGDSIISVKANFTAINSTACGNGYLSLSYVNGNWIGNCSVSSFFTNASQVTPIQKNITFVVENSTGNFSSLLQVGAPVVILLHNLGVPNMSAPGVRFGSGTTNLSNEANFNSVNLIFDIEGNLSLITGGAVNLPNYQDIFLANFTNINLSNPATASALAQFGNAVNVTINSPKSFGDSRIYINSTLIAALNTSATLKFFNLPFASAPNIATDAGAAGVNGSLTWVSNGFVSAFNTTTGNLTFNVLGFSGYNVADIVAPSITMISPGLNSYGDQTSVVINVSINGTGTELSKVIINITNGSGQVNFTMYNASVNTANCRNTTAGGEFYYCSINVTLAANAAYNVNVTAWDYGGASPGNANQLYTPLTIDTNNPSVTLISPADNGDWTSSNDVQFKFNVSDVAIANCTLIISGDATENETDTTIAVDTAQTITHNLDNGDYSWKVTCRDYAGHSDTSSTWDMTVDYTSSSSDDSGGDSAAATSTSFWTNTYSPTDLQIKTGYSKDLKKGERVKIKIGNETHYVGIIKVSSSSATINVSSTPQQAVMDVNETKKFEVTNDNYYDISVTLNRINSTNVNITILSIYELMPESARITAAAASENNETTPNLTGTGAETGSTTPLYKNKWFWIVLGAVVVAGVGAWYGYRRWRYSRKAKGFA